MQQCNYREIEEEMKSPFDDGRGGGVSQSGLDSAFVEVVERMNRRVSCKLC